MTTKDSRHAQLLWEVQESPENDSYRLRYADWIEQEKIGVAPSERAAFIRLQVQAATLKARDPRRIPLERQAYAILDKHAEQWNEPLGSLGVSLVTWERGFPYGGQIDIARFLRNGESITAAGVTALRIKVNTYGMTALAHYAPLARLTNLDLRSNYIGTAAGTTLARSVYLTNLRDLNLASNSIRCDGVMALADCEYLENLTSLNLAHNELSDMGVRALANSARLKNLTSLNLARNAIGVAGLAALASSPHFSPDLTLTVGAFQGTFADFVERHRQEVLNRQTGRTCGGNGWRLD